MKHIATICKSYLWGSLLFGPISVLAGLALTSGGGDISDSSYRSEDGSFNYAQRDEEFNRAETVTSILAGLGIVVGIVCLVSLCIAVQKKSISLYKFITYFLLTLVMIVGYIVAILTMRYP
jgi:hypothetical protein